MTKRAPATPRPGPNLVAVKGFVASLELDEHGLALAALALTLAMELDAGAGLATAGISKELRAVLEALTPEDEDDEDPIPGLSAPLVDPTD